MRITFYGAAQNVTGSQHLIEVNGQRILLDCGFYQGNNAEEYERNLNLPYDARSVNVMVLSHAHMDHSGNIPNLVKRGFRGDIFCTYATRNLCASMLLDSGHIQEKDAEYENKKRFRKGEPPIEPIYNQQEAKESLPYFTGQAYNRPHTIARGVQLKLLDAGHMLGSAIVVLDIEDRDSHREIRLVFSGDLGRVGIPIIRDPQTVDSADVLIMESTYGNRLHPPFEDDEERLKAIVRDTFNSGGMILMPAFAVGRAQQLVYTLHKLTVRGDIPRMPIFVDSPLAIDVTAVYRLHPECYDDEILEFMRENDPFGFSELTYTRTRADSMRLNDLTEPAVIISASGMADHGRILHHLKHHIEDPRTTVLITGWQAPGTLGRRLVEKEHVVRIFGEEYTVNARVEVLNGFSGHADRDELLAWVGAIQRPPRRTFLVHGEPEAASALAQSIKERFNLSVDVPAWKQSFEV